MGPSLPISSLHMRFPSLAATLLCILVSIGRSPATPVDSNFTESVFITSNPSIATPTCIAWAPDGSNRLFVLRKGEGNGSNSIPAEIRVVRNGTVVATPLASFNSYGRLADGLTIKSAPASDPVYTYSECGLLSICFDPNFINNHYLYVFVTVSPSEQQIIRFTETFVDVAPLGGGVGAEDYWAGINKTIIVSGLPTAGVNHDGGGMEFGPDGKLYWSIGDNGTPVTGVDTDLTSLAAKVGRASLPKPADNPQVSTVPNDNPFFDGAGTNNDYIWARGFRNPFTMVFQRTTGKLWLNVVGSAFTGGTNPASGTFGYEQVFVVERGSHGGWNDWENNQPAGFLAPVIAYRTGGTTPMNIAAGGAARVGGVVTFTTTGFHPFRAGAKVDVANVADTSFNGSYYVVDRVSDTKFTVAQAGVNATSGGGTASTLQLGAATGASLTGGCFYDSTAAPAAYLGNFFAGDSVSGLMFRATLGASNQVTSMDLFNTTTGFSQTDTAVGPDGALYFTGYGNQTIRRIAYNVAAQNVIVQPTAFNVVEGGSALFTVRLAQAPSVGNTVTVNVAKISGDADLNISGTATLNFTSANWNQLQTVTITAAEDIDLDNDTATFRVSSTGLTSYDVFVNGIDNDDPKLVISRANLSITEGSSGTFTVNLATAPASTVTVNVARASGDTDISVSSGTNLTFTTGNYMTPQTVTIAAAEDADTTGDAAVISITFAGEPLRTVNVTAADNENVAPAFTTTPVTTAIVNQLYRYDADATGNPAPTYFIAAGIQPGMGMNNDTGLFTWTPATIGSYPITLRASGTAPVANQSFTLNVVADAAPSAAITQPQNGWEISGTNAEFFGNGVDDVGTVKAEFYVDGVLGFTDTAGGDHYHFGGSHFLFNTMQYSNGPHTLRMRVTDTAGQTGFQEVQVTFANGADAWRAEKFNLSNPTDLANSALDVDADGDGLPNVFEYGTDTAPKTPGLSRLPVQQIVKVGGIDYLALQFVMAKWATDLVFRVEAAGNLTGPWTQIDPANPTYRVSAQDNVPSFGLTTVTVRDVVPKGTDPRYMRLRVTK